MMLLWTVCIVLIQAQVAVSQEVEPYVIFSARFGIYRKYFNDTSRPIENLVSGGHGYGALDYHYKRNLLFWINTVGRTLNRAVLSDGSSPTVMLTSPNPVDITVDWINDKLYWVDAGSCEISEYDLATNTTRFILSTGNNHNSYPQGLIIYPYKNNGWLYWTDPRSRSLEMGSIHGGVRESVITNLRCAQALTIDYPTHTVYWADMCEYQFRSIRLNGDRETLDYPFTRLVQFVSSMGKYGQYLFWVEPTGIFMVQNSGEGYRIVMSAPSNTRPISMQVVHPSQQPSEEEYIEIIMNPSDTATYECEPSCDKGLCIPPSFCACYKGWMGAICDEDIDECFAGTHRCEHLCNNTIGDYNCSCRDGFILANDSRSCLNIDECKTNTSFCQHVCINTPGDYSCGCYPGYTLNSDAKTCTDVDECTSQPFVCHHKCTNTDGSYQCSCNLGFLLDDDNHTCTDIDECAAGLRGGCEQICINHNGSYSCRCDLGFSLNEDLKTCARIDVISVLTSIITPSLSTTAANTTTQEKKSSFVTSFEQSTSPAATSSFQMTTETPSLTLSLSSALTSSHVKVSTTELSSSTTLSLTTYFFTPSSRVFSPSATNVLSQIVLTILPSDITSSAAIGISQAEIDVQIQTTFYTVISTPVNSRHISLPVSNTLMNTLPLLSLTTGVPVTGTTSSITPSMSRLVVSSQTQTQFYSSYSLLTSDSKLATGIISSLPTDSTLHSSIVTIATQSSPEVSARSSPEVTVTVPDVSTQSRPEVSVTDHLSSTATSSFSYPAPTSVESSTSTLNQVSSLITTNTNIKPRGTSNFPSSHTISEPSTATSSEPSPSTSKFDIIVQRTNPNLEWQEENKIALVIVGVGVIPALIGVIVMGAILWYRRCHNRGSWTPNHELTGDMMESSTHVASIDEGNISISSFRFQDDYKDPATA